MHFMLPTPNTSGVMMLPSSHNDVRLFFLGVGLKTFNRKRENSAVVFPVLENQLYSVFKRCTFQRSRGSGPKKYMGQAPDPLFCCTAVAIKKV